MEGARPMGRGEQPAPQRKDSPHLQGSDRKDPANYRPITCLPTITKMVTLAIHKRMQRFLFGNSERSILELDQRVVRTSQG